MRAKTGNLLRASLLALLPLVLLAGCDAVSEVLDGQETPLKEPDLPNCSRVVNCCNTLMNKQATRSLVDGVCPTVVDTADKAIEEYRDTLEAIDEQPISAEAKASSKKETLDTAQSTVEPLCRCLIDQTVGQISPNGVLTPVDCEVIPETGTLPAGKTCDDYTSGEGTSGS